MKEHVYTKLDLHPPSRTRYMPKKKKNEVNTEAASPAGLGRARQHWARWQLEGAKKFLSIHL